MIFLGMRDSLHLVPSVTYLHATFVHRAHQSSCFYIQQAPNPGPKWRRRNPRSNSKGKRKFKSIVGQFPSLVKTGKYPVNTNHVSGQNKYDFLIKLMSKTLCSSPGVSFVHAGDGWMQNGLVPLHLNHTFCLQVFFCIANKINEKMNVLMITWKVGFPRTTGQLTGKMAKIKSF